jgi:hypothetical protein
MRRILFLLSVVLVLGSCCAASADDCPSMLMRARTSGEPTRAIRAVLDLRLTPACVVELLLLRSNAQVTRGILFGLYKDATQNAQQNGSSAGSGSSTNLVSKGLTSKVLSLANEYGALAESTTGQTTTVSGSLDGIPLALAAHSQGLIAECPLNLISQACLRSKWLDVLGRFSYSVALNNLQASQLNGTANAPSQGTAQSVSFKSTGSYGTVGQITGKVNILPGKVTFDQLTKAIEGLDANSPLQTSADALDAAAKALRGYQQNAGQDEGEAWDQWVSKTATMLSTTPVDGIVSVWRQQGDSLAIVLEQNGANDKRPTDDQLTQAALTFAGVLGAFGSAERSFYKAHLSGPVLTFQYDENRPNSQPSNSVFRLIYAQSGPAVRNWTFTANGAVSIYDSTPSSSIPGASRLRDIQFGFQGDHDLPKWGPLGTPTFSAAYYFQNQTSPAILNVTPASPLSGINFVGLSANATQAFAQKGKISIGQIKLTFGGSKSGLRVPLAITVSNRTELITASKLGAQIGISYDFDSLFAGK